MGKNRGVHNWNGGFEWVEELIPEYAELLLPMGFESIQVSGPNELGV